MKFVMSLFLLVNLQVAVCQSISELFDLERYRDIVLIAEDRTDLEPEELYMVGQAYFILEEEEMSVVFYDLAIQKGFNTSRVFYSKGISLRLLDRFDQAIDAFNRALASEPNNQKYLSQIAFSYYLIMNLDSALYYARLAKGLPYESGLSYYLIPHIIHLQEDYTLALKGYYEALEAVMPEDRYYPSILFNIGLLEYNVMKNCDNSIKAYSRLINLVPEDYEIYPKLIKAHFACNNYEAGDSIFQIMKYAYDNNLLPEDYMKMKGVSIDEFELNGRRVIAYKYFDKPAQVLDVIYKMYLLNAEGDGVELTIQTEQTIELPKSNMHLLCGSRPNGTHYTYAYGWEDDNIAYEDFKNLAIRVIVGEISPQASSVPGVEKK